MPTSRPCRRGCCRRRWVRRIRSRSPGSAATSCSRAIAVTSACWPDSATRGAPAGLTAGLYLDYKTFLADDVLALSDRMAMAHSLEIRVPFVDHLLVERVFPLPDRTKIGLWRNKRLLKRALRGRLPDEHLRAPKRGFVGPTAEWLRHELRDVIEDELAPERLRRLGYFEPAVVRGLLDDHFARRHNREGILWALLCFSVWHRVYLESGVMAGR